MQVEELAKKEMPMGGRVKQREEAQVVTSGKSARAAQQGPSQPCCPCRQDHKHDSPGEEEEEQVKHEQHPPPTVPSPPPLVL